MSRPQPCSLTWAHARLFTMILEISFTNTEQSSQPGCEIRILWQRQCAPDRYEISVSHYLHNTGRLL
jgi:hypothetical protein